MSEKYKLTDKVIFKIGTTSTYLCKKSSVFLNPQETDKSNACIICCENEFDTLLMPCKHNIACMKCTKNLKECPICRKKIEDFIRIYKA